MLAVQKHGTAQRAGIGRGLGQIILAWVGVGCMVVKHRFRAGGTRRFGVRALGIYSQILGLTSACADSKNHKTMTAIEPKPLNQARLEGVQSVDALESLSLTGQRNTNDSVLKCV